MIMDNFDSPFQYNRPEMTVEAIKKSIVYKLIFLIGRSPREASQRDWLNATLHAVRDLVTEGWITLLLAKLEQKILAVFTTFQWNF